MYNPQNDHPLKRHMVFAFPVDKPRGGWKDFVGSFDTVEEYINFLSQFPKEGWEWHVTELDEPMPSWWAETMKDVEDEASDPQHPTQR